MPKFYAVAIGREPGIYSTWDEAQKQVNGFPGNLHKSFMYLKEAEQFMARAVKDETSEYGDGGKVVNKDENGSVVDEQPDDSSSNDESAPSSPGSMMDTSNEGMCPKCGGLEADLAIHFARGCHIGTLAPNGIKTEEKL